MFPLLILLLGAITGFASLASCACNGEDALCDRLYSNVTLYVNCARGSPLPPPPPPQRQKTHCLVLRVGRDLFSWWAVEVIKNSSRDANSSVSVGSHDSAFVGELITENQHLDLAAQLSLGIRFLQAQTHDWLGEIQMCHTNCLELDAGTLATFLGPVKTFLDANPDEVVTLLLTNGDAISVSDFASVFDSVGLTQYAFTPSGTLTLDQWPTLQAMIDAGTRLVVWMGTWTPRRRPAGFRELLTVDSRLQCQHDGDPLDPGRVLLFLRDTLRRDRLELPRLHDRQALGRKRRRAHGDRQPHASRRDFRHPVARRARRRHNQLGGVDHGPSRGLPGPLWAHAERGARESWVPLPPPLS